MAATTSVVPGSDLVNSPIPDPSNYEQADALAMNAYNNALAAINQKRMATLQQYGYRGQIDPTTGTLSGISVDPTNPYGNLQGLLRDSALQSEQDQQAALSRGLHGGLANQAQVADKLAFGDQSQQLGTTLENALSDLQDQQDSAAYTRDSALHDAELQAAQQAISQGNYDTPSYKDVNTPDYGQTDSQPVTAVRGGGGTTKVAPQLRPNHARDQLIQSLLRQRIAPSTWARQHPARAKQLGISPHHNGNVVVIRQIQHRKGGR